MRVIQSKFTKTKPKIFSNGEGGGGEGGARPARRSWIRLLTSPICARNTDLHVGVRFSSVGTRGAGGDYFLNY